jgi:hypothetical protein
MMQRQKVSGGSGCLKGKEPTGRHPFGKAFKVVVWEPTESDDTVDTKLFFRFKTFCGKSPYVLGPFPFLKYKVNDFIYLGTLERQSLSSETTTSDIFDDTRGHRAFLFKAFTQGK